MSDPAERDWALVNAVELLAHTVHDLTIIIGMAHPQALPALDQMREDIERVKEGTR